MELATFRRSEAFAYLGFVGLPLVVYAGVLIFPALYSIIISLTRWETVSSVSFAGLSNYVKVLRDPYFILSVRNNLLVVAVSVLGQIPLGLLFAYLFHRKLIRGGRVFKPMVFLPVTISSVIVGILWTQMMMANGPITAILRGLLRDPQYTITIMQDPQWAMVPILVTILWFYTGIYMIIFLANLQRLDPALFEAAMLDGLGELKILYHIVAPLLVNVVFTCVIFAITGSLKTFDLIFTMTAGGPNHATETIAIYMYLRSFKYYEYGVGGAVSVILLLLSVALIYLLQRLFSRLTKRFLG